MAQPSKENSVRSQECSLRGQCKGLLGKRDGEGEPVTISPEPSFLVPSTWKTVQLSKRPISSVQPVSRACTCTRYFENQSTPPGRMLLKAGSESCLHPWCLAAQGAGWMDGCKEGKDVSFASRAHHLLKETDTHLHDRHKSQSTELSSRLISRQWAGWRSHGVRWQVGGEKRPEETPG